MQLKIRVEADDEGLTLASLHRWLTQDPDVSREAAVRLESAPHGPGDMGGLFDSITVVVNSSIGLGSLIVAYLSWRDSRPNRSAVSIERDGVVVDLADSSPENVSRIVEVLSDQEES